MYTKIRLNEMGFQVNCYSSDWNFVPAVCQILDWKALIEDNQFLGPPYDPDLVSRFLQTNSHMFEYVNS